MSMPSATPEEITRASREIAASLRKVFRWYAATPPQQAIVNTNIGSFIFYGLQKMKQVEQIGDAKITEAQPHSFHLTAVSHIPTSTQKALLLEMVAMAAAKDLGAPASAHVDRYDPIDDALKATRSLIVVSDSLNEQGKRVDPYKEIKEPMVISVYWPYEAGVNIGGTTVDID